MAPLAIPVYPTSDHTSSPQSLEHRLLSLSTRLHLLTLELNKPSSPVSALRTALISVSTRLKTLDTNRSELYLSDERFAREVDALSSAMATLEVQIAETYRPLVMSETMFAPHSPLPATTAT